MKRQQFISSLKEEPTAIEDTMDVEEVSWDRQPVKAISTEVVLQTR